MIDNGFLNEDKKKNIDSLRSGDIVQFGRDSFRVGYFAFVEMWGSLPPSKCRDSTDSSYWGTCVVLYRKNQFWEQVGLCNGHGLK